MALKNIIEEMTIRVIDNLSSHLTNICRGADIISASFKVTEHSGANNFPMGINHPIIIIIHPRYIIISIKIEKIKVENAPIKDIPPKVMHVSKYVAESAKTDDKTPIVNARINFFGSVFGISRDEQYSDKTIIPSVANADSHSAISYSANGVNKQIIKTAEQREVKESLVFDSKNRAEDIINMIPARVTDTENPVNVI